MFCVETTSVDFSLLLQTVFKRRSSRRQMPWRYWPFQSNGCSCAYTLNKIEYCTVAVHHVPMSPKWLKRRIRRRRTYMHLRKMFTISMTVVPNASRFHDTHQEYPFGYCTLFNGPRLPPNGNRQRILPQL
jgi:hypothetical protein